MTIATWLQFLFGDRDAIVRTARCPQALWLGLAFVLSMGLAREYDGADLWHEPWHLVLPLVASLATSLVLWCLVYTGAISRGLPELAFWPHYRTLLTFYWLTAPLAWVYAVPVERFMSAGDATAANFWFLGVVSVWRVLLISRAISVWLNAHFAVVFFLVMFFADTVAVVLAFVSPTPIFNIMGGIRLSEVDRILLDVTMNVRYLGALSWPVWLIAAVVALAVAKSPWSVVAEPAPGSRVTKSLWVFAGALLVLGLALLPVGQPQQQHAYAATRLLQTNRIDEAVRYMARFPRDAFPPIWDPPPRIGYEEEVPKLTDVLTAIEQQNSPPWLLDVFLEKLRLDPLEVLDDAFPSEDESDREDFDNVFTAIEKYIPPQSLSEYDRSDLLNISKHERIKAAFGDRIREYLRSQPDD